MGVIVEELAVTTNGSGDATATVTPTYSGPKMLYQVQWKDGDLADGVDAVLKVTDVATGVDTTLLTLTDANDDAVYYPRLLEQDNAGADLTTYAMPLVNGTLTLTVSSGGAAKSGSMVLTLIT